MNELFDRLQRDLTQRDLNDCGCCEGLTVQTPVEVINRPGLGAISYRVGTQVQFKQSLLTRLSDPTFAALNSLKTRDDDDFTIALLDAWATVLDVLTFYQERIANEAYLRTATERVSLLYLAQLIGYELRPGVAASTFLAFTLDDEPGVATIEAGTKVQSIPEAGEQPVTFETVERLAARVQWNTLKPRLSRRHPLPDSSHPDRLFFAGTATGLQTGDGLLISLDNSDVTKFLQIAEVIPQPEREYTQVRLEKPLDSTTNISDLILEEPVDSIKDIRDQNPRDSNRSIFQLLNSATEAEFSSTTLMAQGRPGLSTSARLLLDREISGGDLQAYAQTQGEQAEEILNNLSSNQLPPSTVIAFRTKAAIFGHNAPRWETLPNVQRFGEFVDKDTSPPSQMFVDGPYSDRETSWVDDPNDPTQSTSLKDYPIEKNSKNLYLDNVYPNIVKNSWIVLQDGDNDCPYIVDANTELSVSDFTLTAKISRLELAETNTEFENFRIRTTTVFAESEALELARLPIEEPISGTTIDLEGGIDGLFVGQTLLVCGELEDSRGNRRCEAAIVARVDYVAEDGVFTKVELQTQLNNAYIRETVTIFANVLRATQGETTEEVLGSGDANQPYQRFTLNRSPLTYVSAPTPSGAESTLQVRVDDVRWDEVPTLFGRGPSERVYITRRNDEGETTIQFGNGQLGARLPTGLENIQATYRQGIGLAGLVKADQLSLLTTRPPGVSTVTNPLPATGAEEPESRDQARQNAPLTVLTLDRIVSLQDYEDFARAYAGIAKALATWTWNGQVRGVFVTVAGPEGSIITVGSPVYNNLLAAMRQAGDPFIPLRV